MMRILALLASVALLGACSMLPGGTSNSDKPRAGNAQSVAATPAARQCLGKLNATGARFIAKADAYGGKGCSNINTVSLSAMRGDRSQFEVTNLGTVSCPVANTFAAWTRFGVDRAARQILGSPIERIETMGSYSCRNVAGSSRRSAHSTADAVDVSAFVLKDGRRISLSGGWNSSDRREREFLRVVHKSACKRFGTVLGPDYNAAHRDHFHLERGDGSFCR
ncbi:extensin family protein [Altererythrobacter sp. ZODW24]|uniref:extensin family protein n=1 Tax=Altererythrobacter sp. ZODW24 TaxID=2185142 RepID=UPI001966B1CB|nr:extensin family protein [Altererythrobacter sp. ZODW24]